MLKKIISATNKTKRTHTYLLCKREQQRLDEQRQRGVAVVDRNVARQRAKRLDDRLVEQCVGFLKHTNTHTHPYNKNQYSRCIYTQSHNYFDALDEKLHKARQILKQRATMRGSERRHEINDRQSLIRRPTETLLQKACL